MICYHGTINGMRIINDRAIMVSSKNNATWGVDRGSLKTTYGRVYLGKSFDTALDYAIRAYGSRYEEKPLIHIFEIDLGEIPYYNDPDDDEPNNITVKCNLLSGQHVRRYKIVTIESMKDGWDKLDSGFFNDPEWIDIN